MKSKKLIRAVACGGMIFVLAACGETPILPHKDVKIYSAKFYNSTSKQWETKTGLSWADAYDATVAQTKLTSGDIRNEYLHSAEDILMETGAVCPLYYYTDVYLEAKELTGFYCSPLGYKFFQGCTLGTSTEFSVCVGPKGDSFDPAVNSAVDGAIVISHVFEGLMKWKAPATGEVASELELGQADSKDKVVNADGTVTWTFHIRDNAKWSDGTSVTPSQFKASWTRAASGKLAADYGYMFDCVVGYDAVAADSTGTVDFAGVVADDAARTLKVTINSDLPYFEELTAFPTYSPVRLDKIAEGHEGDWWTDAANYVGNGAMKVTKMDNKDGGSIVFEPNTNYWDAQSVKATKITFGLSDDDSNIYTNFNNKTYCFVDSFPNDQIETEKNKPAATNVFHVNGQLGTYYVIFNVNDATFNAKLKTEAEKASLRKALGLMIDRNYICEAIGQAGQEPANTFVGKGVMENHDDGSVTEWTTKSGKNRDGKGYYKVGKADFEQNCKDAIAAIKGLGYNFDEKQQKFTDVPSITYLYNAGTGHQAIGEYLQSAFGAFGINLKLESQEWAVFLNTRKDGNYSIARNGWLADYNDACSFIDMWTTNSGNNDAQFGR